jgi:hypothetical protein
MAVLEAAIFVLEPQPCYHGLIPVPSILASSSSGWGRDCGDHDRHASRIGSLLRSICMHTSSGGLDLSTHQQGVLTRGNCWELQLGRCFMPVIVVIAIQDSTHAGFAWQQLQLLHRNLHALVLQLRHPITIATAQKVL